MSMMIMPGSTNGQEFLSPEIAAPPAEPYVDLGDLAMRAYVASRLSENGENYNQYTADAAAMLGADEQQVAYDVFNALGNGDGELGSLYDRWHQERPAGSMQGPMLPPSMLKQGVAKRLDFEDVRSMDAAAFAQRRAFDEEMRLLQAIHEEDEEDDGEEDSHVARTGSKRRQGRSLPTFPQKVA